MRDLNALLAAVRAEPDADLPRLVYADALDDAGQAERAEFVRVQCALAGMPDWDERRPALEDREHELLDRYEADWLGPVPDGLEEWEWGRGLVDEVRVTDLADSLAGFADRQAIRAVACHGGNAAAPGDLFADAGGWPATVSRLNLTDAHWIGVEDVAPVLAADRLPRLTALDLSNTVLPAEPDFWHTLASAPLAGRLTALALDADYEPPDASAMLAGLRGCPLTELRLAGGGALAGPAFAQLLSDHGSRVTTLDLYGCGSLMSDAVRAFERLPADAPLARLDVTDSLLATSLLGRLLAAPGLGRLSRLDASQAYDRGASLAELASSDFWGRAVHLRRYSCGLAADLLAPLCAATGPPELRLLDLHDNPLGPAAARYLTEAPWFGSLVWLSLSGTAATDDAVAALAASGTLGALRTLHLAHNDLTDAAATTLSNTASLNRLRLLTLSGARLSHRAIPSLLCSPYWRLSGLGLSGCDLSAPAVEALARYAGLRRLVWLDLSDNPWLRGHTLMPLAESPHLSRLCELDIGGCGASDRVRDALRERLGRRLSD